MTRARELRPLDLDSQPRTLAHMMARLENRPGIKTGRRTSRTV